MWNYTHQNELYHHGVKGMKWGRRRYQNPDGSLTEEGKRREAQKESVAQKKADKKYRGTLSDSDLRAKINRLQMEKQLRELTNEEINAGKSTVLSIVKAIGTDAVKSIATTALKGAALYGLKAAVSKQFNAEEMAKAIFNGGAKKT